MSQENVEIVRRAFEAFNRRDMTAFLDLLDPDVEWVPILAVLEGRVYRGHKDVRRWVEDLLVGEQHLQLSGLCVCHLLLLWRGRGECSERRDRGAG